MGVMGVIDAVATCDLYHCRHATGAHNAEGCTVRGCDCKITDRGVPTCEPRHVWCASSRAEFCGYRRLGCRAGNLQQHREAKREHPSDRQCEHITTRERDRREQHQADEQQGRVDDGRDSEGA